MNWRYLPTIVVLFLWCIPALAADKCSSTVDGKYLYSHGGRLVHTRDFPIGPLPQNFLCDRVACPGLITFSILIDEKGRVTPLKVIHNSFQFEPDWHASVVSAFVKEGRYKPPRF